MKNNPIRQKNSLTPIPELSAVSSAASSRPHSPQPRSSGAAKKKAKSLTGKYPTGPVLAVLSALLLLLFGLFELILPDRDYSASEKRTLSSAPAFRLSSFLDGSFMDDLESWLSDQLPGRDAAVSAASLYDRLTGPDLSNGVLLGNNGWLFQLFNGSGYSKTTWSDLLSFLETEDCPSYILLAPNAISVCEESSSLSRLIPSGASSCHQREWYESWKESAEAEISSSPNSEIHILDVFDALQSAWESDTQVYYQTDHHWTTRGAQTAYAAVCSDMNLSGFCLSSALQPVCSHFRGSLISKSGFQISSEDVIEILPPEDGLTTTVYYEEEQDTEISVYNMDGLKGNDPYEVFFGGNHALVKITSDCGTGRKLLVLKDSYANSFLPFLIPDFDTIILVDPRYYNGNVKELADTEEFTDILVLYNINTFCEDRALSMVLNCSN